MQPIPFDQFKTEYLGILNGPRYSRRTMKKMDQVLRQVAALGVESTDQLTTVNAARYAESRITVVCANTVRGELAYFRAACNYAVEEDYLGRSPRWRRVWPRKSPRRRKALHSVADLARVGESLLAGAEAWDGHRLLVAFSLASLAGLRRDELLRLKWEDVDGGASILLVVPRHRLKTEASERLVPLCPELVAILRAWRWRSRSEFVVPAASDRSKPWVSGGRGRKPTQRLVAVGLEIGVTGLTFQSLRHSFATWGRRRFGIPGPVMRDILGHTLIATHECNYLHSPGDAAELVAAVARFSYRAT